MPPADVTSLLRRDPSATVLSCDFDGTLAPIVDDPARSAPIDGATEVLAALAQRYAVVAVLSGRPVGFLDPLLPDSVEVHGLYGLEWRVGGVRGDHESAGAWRETIADVAASAKGWMPDGIVVEPKGLSLTIHYRTRPDAAVAVHAWADEQAARSGLALRTARMSVELHPPVGIDKGSVLLALGTGYDAAAFIGDDAGDLAAFDALDELAVDGVEVARVAVTSDEAPAELLARADLAVDGPEGVLALLRSLLD